MPNSKAFKKILKEDGYTYVVTCKETEPVDINFPNLPDWHQDEFEDEESNHEYLPDSTVIWFEYKTSLYRLLINDGWTDTNDGTFGALFDANNDKILDVLSTGDMESTLVSLKDADDAKLDDDFLKKLSPYLQHFSISFENSTELEYLVFKVLAQNDCWMMGGIDELDDPEIFTKSDDDGDFSSQEK